MDLGGLGFVLTGAAPVFSERSSPKPKPVVRQVYLERKKAQARARHGRACSDSAPERRRRTSSLAAAGQAILSRSYTNGTPSLGSNASLGDLQENQRRIVKPSPFNTNDDGQRIVSRTQPTVSGGNGLRSPLRRADNGKRSSPRQQIQMHQAKTFEDPQRHPRSNLHRTFQGDGAAHHRGSPTRLRIEPPMNKKFSGGPTKGLLAEGRGQRRPFGALSSVGSPFLSGWDDTTPVDPVAQPITWNPDIRKSMGLVERLRRTRDMWADPVENQSLSPSSRQGKSAPPKSADGMITGQGISPRARQRQSPRRHTPLHTLGEASSPATSPFAAIGSPVEFSMVSKPANLTVQQPQRKSRRPSRHRPRATEVEAQHDSKKPKKSPEEIEQARIEALRRVRSANKKRRAAAVQQERKEELTEDELKAQNEHIAEMRRKAQERAQAHVQKMKDKQSEGDTEVKRGADFDAEAIEEERRRALERSRNYDKKQKAAREAREREEKEQSIKRSQMREERKKQKKQRRREIYAMNQVMAAWGTLQMARFNEDAGVQPSPQHNEDDDDGGNPDAIAEDDAEECIGDVDDDVDDANNCMAETV